MNHSCNFKIATMHKNAFLEKQSAILFYLPYLYQNDYTAGFKSMITEMF